MFIDPNCRMRHRRAGLGLASPGRRPALHLAALLAGAAPLSPATAQDETAATDISQDQLAPEEIIVSARRRDEKLTSVPASITAYSSHYLQTQNIQDFNDYATRVPNLSFQYGQGGSLFWAGDRQTTIRGVGGAGTTSYYINDTPVPSSVSPLTLDLDRIEVLKGPQGTLFGASSMGGNLRFITKQPSLDQSSGAIQLQAGGTRQGGFDGQANVQANFVLVPDRLAVDVAAGYTRDSGYITRRFPDASGKLVSVDDQGRNEIAAASASLRAKVTDDLEATVSFIGQLDNLHGFPAAYVPLPDYRPRSYVSDRDADIQEYSRDAWGLGSFVLNYAGNGFSVVSSTSYFARRIRQLEDDTEGGNLFLLQTFGSDYGHPPITSYSETRERRVTHEDRIAFDEGTLLPHLSGIVGFFYQHQHSHSVTPINHIPALPAEDFPQDWLGANDTANHTNDAALFGELYYELLPRLTLTLGLRKYWTTLQTEGETNSGILYPPTGFETVPPQRNSQSGWVPKAVLSYKIGSEGNVYISASKGFRPGGSSTSFPDICTPDLARLGLEGNKPVQYGSDTLWSYELGAKGRLADGRLTASAAAFEIDWSQIQQTALLPGCLLTVTANAGKARIRGGEFELSGRPLPDVPLTIELGLGYTHGVLQQPGLLPYSANSPLPLVPDWTGTVSASYEGNLTDSATVFVAADYSYSSSTKVGDGIDGFYTRQPIDMVNANGGLRFGKAQVMVFVKNLLDKRLNYGDQPAASFEREEQLPDGSYQRLPRGVVSRPRQIGVQFQMDF